MSYRHTLEAALESLHEIEDLIKGFPGEGNIPSIEIDLTLQKIRNMYELMLMMKKSVIGDDPHVVPDAVSKEAVSVEKKATAEKKTAVEKKSEAAETVAVEEKPPTEEKKPATKGKDVQTLADQFKGKPTLHESLHQSVSKDETLAHAKPVTNLLEAIGINDRYTFIRELFSGDASKYDSSMKFLNDAASFNDAYNYMIMYFNWDMDSEAVKLLLDIIRRKFIKGRHE